MSYEPTNWESGDVVTSAKLNKLENGVANNGILIVHNEKINATGNSRRLDKTWMEIHDALLNGTIVCILYSHIDEYEEDISVSFITKVYTAQQQPQLYYVYINNSVDGFTTDSADGYPEYKDEEDN